MNALDWRSGSNGSSLNDRSSRTIDATDGTPVALRMNNM
jgi:hypothetical protein